MWLCVRSVVCGCIILCPVLCGVTRRDESDKSRHKTEHANDKTQLGSDNSKAKMSETKTSNIEKEVQKTSLEDKNAARLTAENLHHKVIVHGDNINMELDHSLDSHTDTANKKTADESKLKAQIGKANKEAMTEENIRHKIMVHGNIGTELDHDLASHGRKVNKPKNKDTMSAEELKHRAMMHGGAVVDHDISDHNIVSTQSNGNEKAIPSLDEKVRHGLMMHGNLNADLNHEHTTLPVKKHPRDIRIYPDPNMMSKESSSDEGSLRETADKDEAMMNRIRMRLKGADFKKVSTDKVEKFVDWLVIDEVTNGKSEYNADTPTMDTTIPTNIRKDVEEIRRQYLRDYFVELNKNNDYDIDPDHGVDDIIDVMDMDDSDDDFVKFMEKQKYREGL